MMASGWYVYAITSLEATPPPCLLGLDDAPLVPVRWRALAAVASRVDGATIPPTLEHLLRHEEVVEALRERAPALPVRFGTVLADRPAVARALARRYAVLRGDLERLGDRLELGLAVLWEPPGPGADESRGDHDGYTAPASALDSMGPGARYLWAGVAAERRERDLRRQAELLARDVEGALRPHALESRCVVLPTPRLALRSAYLVEPAGAAPFLAAFEEVRRARASLRFLLSGPWPPYSFVTPDSTAARASQIQEGEQPWPASRR